MLLESSIVSAVPGLPAFKYRTISTKLITSILFQAPTDNKDWHSDSSVCCSETGQVSAMLNIYVCFNCGGILYDSYLTGLLAFLSPNESKLFCRHFYCANHQAMQELGGITDAGEGAIHFFLKKPASRDGCVCKDKHKPEHLPLVTIRQLSVLILLMLLLKKLASLTEIIDYNSLVISLLPDNVLATQRASDPCSLYQRC